LADLSQRLSTALEAGIDARTVWAREAQRATGSLRGRLQIISQAINGGASMAEGLADAGDYFPPLFRQLAEVGEQTGHQGEIFHQLADHYQHQLALRRSFLAAITWPLTELTLAVLIVGFLIWIMGIINQTTGGAIDPLGFGLVGNRGLAIYVGLLAVVGLILFATIQAVRRGLVWTRPIQRFMLWLPVLGPALQTLALARLAWTMHLTLNAGMEIRRALRLSLRNARNARYSDQIPRIDAEIGRGNSLYEAFCGAGGYPAEFLDALAVSEQSGRVVESMALLSRQYQERARLALATLTMLAGYGVWAVIAGVIIAVIFRLFGFYLGAINSAVRM
jgi:type IV pilus assembly protein PilC